MRDYYEILGVGRDADGEVIKKAYRKLALQFHPDRNSDDPGAEEKFKEATEAYEILRDPEKRSAYDRFGHAGVKGAAAGAGFGGFNFTDALEIFMRDFGGAFGFEDLFGGASRRSGGRGVHRRGSDVRVRLPLTLAEVASGVRRKLKLQVLEPCTACGGTGGHEGERPARCATCGGAGEVRRVQRSFLGQMVSVSPCPACGGEGHVIDHPCEECQSRGVAPQEKTIEVEIPAGVSSGDYITLRGTGNAGPRGGPRGDVMVVVDVEEDARFARDGADLILDLPVTFTQAVLGAEVEVPTVTGSARVKIPAGTQSGRLLRMRGKGLPHLRGGGKGDMIVRVLVWTPTELTAEQEALLRQLAPIETAPPAPGEQHGEKGFWSKVKGAFSA